MDNPYRYLRFCAWSGPVLLVVLVVFWAMLSYNLPPYPASSTAQEIADHFNRHATQVRIGLSVSMLFGVCYLTWGMAITKVMEQAEGASDILSRLQLWGAGFTALVIEFPSALWLTAAFRPDTDPKILQMLYDTGWIMFDMPYSLTALQLITFGVCFLFDRRTVPLVPKWASWFAIWSGCMFVLFLAMPFFRDGPFSRSGILNFWVEFSIFFVAMLVMSICTLRAIPRLYREWRETGLKGSPR
jgi:hypothetical protein